ncbi:transglutaminase family protein, partial [Mycobacterium tuberculosis]|nr:transglutaminase family protein [Mycobacterium tuberculosis]
DLAEELKPYRTVDPLTPGLAAYVDRIDRSPKPIVDFLVDLNQQLSRDIRYVIRMEPGVQEPEETLELACGSCRDTGWLLVQ